MKNKILCINFSSAIQRTLFFEEFSPEKVNRSNSYILTAGGKALNSAKVLNQLVPDSAEFLCAAGKENFREFKKILQTEKLKGIFIKIPGKTRQCWTALHGGKTTEIISEENTPIDEKSKKRAHRKFFHAFYRSLKNCRAVILAGTLPKIWNQNLYTEICTAAASQNKIVLADFFGEKLTDALKNAPPSIVKINEEEFLKTFALDGQNSKPSEEVYVKTKMQELSAAYKNIFIVTRGENPVFASQNGNFTEAAAQKVKCVNTTGCGDTFNAGFLSEFLESGNLKSSLENAVRCASLNAKNAKPGCITEDENSL